MSGGFFDVYDHTLALGVEARAASPADSLSPHHPSESLPRSAPQAHSSHATATSAVAGGFSERLRLIQAAKLPTAFSLHDFAREPTESGDELRLGLVCPDS